ncbi:hypothetical protein BO82DRAFT_361191 [Aspergillus uvarum CBS 121591]|uniref:NmrA-like domain-containing protein n=1 Tax=Aspergillus uvarum CBS 121591 TaxID=1448315 RepID=A0A319DCI5_9EURO|nr:hypothetical protein BO82DRAFT_361191 [Aspergillus uvarum CBS 121591]PYH85788.1 hypothetical protein BO82DRAFT_361191 [Aspergillus uvarum CBS 121591]
MDSPPALEMRLLVAEDRGTGPERSLSGTFPDRESRQLPQASVESQFWSTPKACLAALVGPSNRVCLESPAVVKVLYRPGSNAQGLPSDVTAVQVDITDEETLVATLRDVDILMLIDGHSAIKSQHNPIRAIPKTKVQLFVPSDFAVRYSGQGLGIELINDKIKVEEAAEKSGVPTTVVLTGDFAEFAFDIQAMGVDRRHDRIILTGNSASQPLNPCTREYVAAAFASIFSTTPIPQLQNRTLSLSELRPYLHIKS